MCARTLVFTAKIPRATSVSRQGFFEQSWDFTLMRFSSHSHSNYSRPNSNVYLLKCAVIHEHLQRFELAPNVLVDSQRPFLWIAAITRHVRLSLRAHRRLTRFLT